MGAQFSNSWWAPASLAVRLGAFLMPHPSLLPDSRAAQVPCTEPPRLHSFSSCPPLPLMGPGCTHAVLTHTLNRHNHSSHWTVHSAPRLPGSPGSRALGLAEPVSCLQTGPHAAMATGLLSAGSPAPCSRPPALWPRASHLATSGWSVPCGGHARAPRHLLLGSRAVASPPRPSNPAPPRAQAWLSFLSTLHPGVLSSPQALTTTHT